MIKSFYEGKLTILNDGQREEWDLVIDTDQGEFFIVWEDNGFDLDWSDMTQEMKSTIQCNSETAHHLINGVFKLVGDR